MKIATWNVNSVKMRLPLLLEWLTHHAPDVLLLQEIKCEADGFPFLELQGIGYQALVKGQKSYNGVALLSKTAATLRRDSLPGDAGDTQARYIEAEVNGWIIASYYLPNGNPLGTEKFTYKLAWMERFYRHAQSLLETEKPVVLGGDSNVILEPRDAAHPEHWTGDALFQPESRGMLRATLHLGFVDAYRCLHPNAAHAYTFWDYQAGAWPRDDGIRIDHLLLSPEATDRLKACHIEREWRGRDKASDHTLVVADFANQLSVARDQLPGS